MYFLIKIRHDIIITQFMGTIMKWEKLNYMLEIDILRNYFPKDLVVMRGGSWGIGCPKDALLAKTMAQALPMLRPRSSN